MSCAWYGTTTVNLCLLINTQFPFTSFSDFLKFKLDAATDFEGPALLFTDVEAVVVDRVEVLEVSNFLIDEEGLL